MHVRSWFSDDISSTIHYHTQDPPSQSLGFLKCLFLWGLGYNLGLKKFASIPEVTKLHIAPVTTKTLRTSPEIPRAQLSHQNGLYSFGFLIKTHIKQGYAKVIGSAIPPINPAKLGKNGSAIATKNAKNPNKTLIPDRTHLGHGPFLLLVYNLNSKLSKTGIAYIWNELRLFMTTSRHANPRSTFDVSWRWYLYHAVNTPSFVRSWGNKQTTMSGLLYALFTLSFSIKKQSFISAQYSSHGLIRLLPNFHKPNSLQLQEEKSTWQ